MPVPHIDFRSIRASHAASQHDHWSLSLDASDIFQEEPSTPMPLVQHQEPQPDELSDTQPHSETPSTGENMHVVCQSPKDHQKQRKHVLQRLQQVLRALTNVIMRVRFVKYFTRSVSAGSTRFTLLMGTLPMRSSGHGCRSFGTRRVRKRGRPMS